MLQTLREKTSGWIATVILGLLIIPFAFFGVNNYFETRADTWVAKVGEQEISADEFRSRFEEYRQQMRRMLGENFDSSTLETPEAKLRVLNGMVDQELLRQAGQNMGLTVAPALLRKEIEQIEAFHVNGSFDLQQYRVLLATQNMSPLQFESRLRAELETRTLPAAVGETALATTFDVDTYFRLRDQTRDLRFITLDAPAADTLPAADDAALKAYYEANTDRYMSEEMISIEYLIADAAQLEIDSTPSDDTLRSRYEEQKSRFTAIPQRLASHILIKVPADADAEAQQAAQAKAAELVAKARAEGADFAALAKEFSDDIGSKATGGDLGWIEPGFTDPAFETALFALEAGAISEPVKSAEGWHVIWLRELRPGDTQPFEAVREQLLAEYQETERERVHSDLAGRLIDITYRDPSTLATAADELDLQLHTVGPFGRMGGEDPISRHPDVLRTAFSEAAIRSGEASDALDLGEGRTGVIRVVEHQPSKPLPYEEVQAQVASDWQQSELARLLDERAQALLKRLQAGEALADLAKELGVEVQEHAGIGRNASTVNPRIASEAFALARPSAEQPVRALVDLGGNQKALLEVTKVEDGKVEAVSADERSAVRDQLAQAVGAAEVRELLDALRQGAEVRIAEERL